MARHLRLLVALLALTVSASRPAAAAPPSHADEAVGRGPAHTFLAPGDTARAPLDLSMGQPVVQVYLNGHGPYRMFLDTGAGTTVVDRSVAQELGLAKIGETRLGDPANPHAIAADIVAIDSLRIGNATFGGVTAASWDRSALRPGPNMPRGVVGLPVFRELLESIDFPNAALKLTRGHLGDSGDVIRYRTLGGVPLIPLEVAGARFDAHLDTGSPGFLSIPEKDSSRVRFAEPLREVGRGRTVNSVVTFRGATLDGAVRVGGATFDRPLVMLNDKLPVANLGSRALRDCVVTLDAANQRLRIERTRESAPPAATAPAETHELVAGPAPGEKSAGVMLSPQPDGSLLVVGTLPGSAAAHADIQAGDRVLALNGDSITGLSHDENRARLHRSPVRITLERAGRTFDVTLEF